MAPTPARLRFRVEYTELDEWIEETPATATLKGMFVDSFLKSVEKAGYQRPTTTRFISFKDYSLRDFMRMLVDAACATSPNLPPREGLRLLGQNVYPTLAGTTIGGVLFSVAGRNFKTALTVARKAYEISLSPGSAEVVDLAEGSATVQLRDIWNFADSYQVGVMEGAMAAYGVKGTVAVRAGRRRCDADLLLTWRARP